jgi:hypothetical protein
LDRAADSDPVEIFIEVLRRYLHDRGHIVLSMAEASGQRVLKMALRGLWRRYEAGSTKYYWFMDVVEELRRCSECLERLKEYGVLEFTEVDGEPYMLVDVVKLRRLWSGVEKGDEE